MGKTNKLVIQKYREKESIDIGFEHLNNHNNELFLLLSDNVVKTIEYVSNRIKN